jgi:hypothetical protein
VVQEERLIVLPWQESCRVFVRFRAPLLCLVTLLGQIDNALSIGSGTIQCYVCCCSVLAWLKSFILQAANLLHSKVIDCSMYKFLWRFFWRKDVPFLTWYEFAWDAATWGHDLSLWNESHAGYVDRTHFDGVFLATWHALDSLCWDTTVWIQKGTVLVVI